MKPRSCCRGIPCPTYDCPPPPPPPIPRSQQSAIAIKEAFTAIADRVAELAKNAPDTEALEHLTKVMAAVGAAGGFSRIII